ncbi:type II secretion system protein [Candidatus Nucleicultrix amoebiphila]|jgi:prepilin-type N-terminal cleavage/methylation domain-containing protein|uniref:type II secretion system protein n=1 Tax=Candidatus Nucleicultrix amoebiphila TaxID=1509244 RepID=UPI0018DCA69C|nr:prepilin-type N-terminal cleavage/methylation domain-containing protein [Candidatus Nucleicultrix amoebiphila]
MLKTLKNAAFCIFNFKKLRSTQDGFSLIEIAIALAIMGILASFTLPLLTLQLETRRYKKTLDHLEIVMVSLAAYLLRNGHLPCPASDIFGKALKICDSSKLFIGYVPYHSLGISLIFANDGFYKPILYAVEPNLTQTNKLQGQQERSLLNYCTTTGQTLKIFDEKNESIVDLHKGFIAVVLEAPQKSQKNLENSSPHFVQTKIKELESSIVKWTSRDQLISHYGKFPCRLKD